MNCISLLAEHNQKMPNSNAIKQLFSADISAVAALHPVQEMPWRQLNDKGLRFFIKRDDLIDTQVSGNKVYKLWGHLQQAQQQGATQILSFGGAWSNHLHALAAVGNALNIKTIGVVRGLIDPLNQAKLSATLKDCQAFNMTLVFVSRQDYLLKHLAPSVQRLLSDDATTYVVPEGGGGAEGSLFCRALVKSIEDEVPVATTICLPCGTGTTLSGMVRSASSKIRLLGVSALKPTAIESKNTKPSLYRDVESQIPDDCDVSWDIRFDHHCGGYAKITDELVDFMQTFTAETGVLLDPVYTGKMMLAIAKLAQQNYWQAGDSVAALHTGGLQGRRGFNVLQTQELTL